MREEKSEQKKRERAQIDKNLSTQSFHRVAAQDAETGDSTHVRGHASNASPVIYMWDDHSSG